MSITVLSKANFEQTVLKADKPVLVDFWADWCTPCKMLAPVVEKLAEKLEAEVTFAKLNIDDEPDLAAQYRVMSIPTLIVFKDGQATDRSVGVVPETQIMKMLGK